MVNRIFLRNLDSTALSGGLHTLGNIQSGRNLAKSRRDALVIKGRQKEDNWIGLCVRPLMMHVSASMAVNVLQPLISRLLYELE